MQFRSVSGTGDNGHYFYSQAITGKEKQEAVCGIVNMEKAFDAVSYEKAWGRGMACTNRSSSVQGLKHV